MKQLKITSIARDRLGKESSKKERKEGLLPAVIYGRQFSLPVVLPFVSLKVLRSINFSETSILEMTVDGYEGKDNKFPVIIKDVQYHPLTEEPIHMDFVKVSLEEKIRVNVSVVLKGECPGVKEGGILEQMLWEIELESLPLNIPEKIELDVSSMKIGDSIHVKDLSLAEGIKILESPDETIVTVVAKHEEVVEEEAGIEPATAEPEVIKEKEKEAKEPSPDAKDKEKDKGKDKGKA